MRDIENSTVNPEVRPWEWETLEDYDDVEDEDYEADGE